MDLKINNYEIFNAIFDNSNNVFKLNVILDISQPIIYELNYEDKKYLIYVLRDMTKMKDEKQIKIQELLFSEVDKEVIEKLIKSEISIYDSFLNSNKIWRTGKIGEKIFPRKMLENVSEIQDRFPIQDVKLKDIPNKAFYS